MNKINTLTYLSAISFSCLVLNMGFNIEKVNALTLTGKSCSANNVGGASSCSGIYSGNNSNQNLNGLFGINNWGNEFLKVDGSSGSQNRDNITLMVNSNRSGSSGNWSLSNIDFTRYNVMAVLKGGTSFTAYLLNSSSGTWNNSDILRGNGQRGAGLSHFSIYTSAKVILPQPPQPVPEPLTILGTGLALGLGGLFKLKRKQMD